VKGGHGHERLLRWYPPAWRDRYGEELAAYLEDAFPPGRLPWRSLLSLAVGGIGERARYSGIAGDRLPAADRMRAAVLVVLCSWTAFVVGGSSFAKLSEHFDEALPASVAAHRLPDLAFTVVQVAAGGAGCLVVLGAALAVPALIRFLRSGGWAPLRPYALAAAACTVVAAGSAFPLSIWAHHLNDSQRNAGLSPYTGSFLAWAASVVASLVLWTTVAVVAARHVSFSRTLLLAEATLAVAVAAAMGVILVSTGVWWAELARSAPSFLNADPALPVTLRLAATVGLMLVASLTAAAGVARLATNPLLRSARLEP
jgi:hypothetical protein